MSTKNFIKHKKTVWQDIKFSACIAAVFGGYVFFAAATIGSLVGILGAAFGGHNLFWLLALPLPAIFATCAVFVLNRWVYPE